MSFTVLFNSYKNLLNKKELEHKKTCIENKEEKEVDPFVSSTDIQSATKKIFSIAVQQNAETLNKVSFYDTLHDHFIKTNKDTDDDDKDDNNNDIHCSYLLKEIGWDLLTELFLLYNKDERFSNFLLSICAEISPRELSIMFSEVFTHPILSINATHHHYQLHIMQNHYILNEEDTEQQKQMMNLNISNSNINMDASDDILSFHKNINYIKMQTLFVKCIIILFKRLTAKTTSKFAINHFYQSLIPTAILHFQTLSKELSYQFYLHNMTLYHDHHSHHGHGHSHSLHSHSKLKLDGINALDATKKQQQDWLINSKQEYEIYLDEIYKLFALMVNNHCDLKDNETEIKDAPVDVNELIKCFQPHSEEEDQDEEENEQIKAAKLRKSQNHNTLWLARYGFGVLSGVYWWYNVVYNEDIEADGDVNNDSAEILHNIKKPSYNIFMTDIVDGLKREILVKLCHSVGMNGKVLLGLRDYLSKLESKLESEKPWHLNSDQLNQLNKSNPTTPTPQLQPMSSIGHPDLNTIVEEQEDDMIDITEMMEKTTSNDNDDDNKQQKANGVHTAKINAKDEEQEEEEDDEDGMVVLNGNMDNDDDAEDDDAFGGDDAGWDDDNNNIDFGDVDPSKLKKMQETQALVDELKTWNEYVELFGVTCYYHSLWVLLQSDDCTENGGILFKKHSKYFWKCIQSLFEQLTTLPAGIEFGEFILNTTVGKMSNKDLKVECRADLDKLLNSAQFHDQGLWQFVQYLTSQLKGISDRALHQKLWQFIVHLINAADLKTRFQCIVSTALQCPIPVVQSLMFTELKNQIFNNWNIDLGEEKEDVVDEEEDVAVDDGMVIMEDTLNPFCSRQVVMVLVQRLSKELQNISLQNIYQELDSLNACLNLCRFILTKDKDTNYTEIYDKDCPLKQVIQTLCDEMTKISNDEDIAKKNNKNNKGGNDDGMPDLEQFQRQMMKNQFLVSLDLVKRILEMYK